MFGAGRRDGHPRGVWGRRDQRHRQRRHRRRPDRDPGRDQRAVPGRRLQRRRHLGGVRDRPSGHPVQLRRLDDDGRGHPVAARVHDPGHGERQRALRGCRRLRLAVRPRRPLLDVLRGDRERELPARRPDRRRGRQGVASPASSRRATPAAGRTSTSRSTPTRRRSPTPTTCIATSQLALPKDVCDTVYATEGYEESVTNLSQVTLETDNVFGDDGGEHQLGTVTGERHRRLRRHADRTGRHGHRADRRWRAPGWRPGRSGRAAAERWRRRRCAPSGGPGGQPTEEGTG